MRFFDAHCHLTDEKVYGDIENVISQALLVGVDKFLTMGGGRSDWGEIEKLADRHESVFAAFGWHPEDLKRVEDIEDLKLKLKHPKALAVGETGLDFYWDKEKITKEVQMIMLEKQMNLAKELNKPIIIHCRSAEDEMLTIMKKTGGFKAHFHCFGESRKLLEVVLENDHMVSFGGNVTFKSAGNLREMLKIVPLNQLLLETDTPYLSPEPLRGRLNQPSHLPETAHFIAKELKIETEELARATYKNTLCFFGLEN